MGEGWDWRQKYAQYADTAQGDGSPYPPTTPAQGPDAPVPGLAPYAAPYGPPQPYGQPYAAPYAGPYPQYYAAYPASTNQGRGFTIASFIIGGIGLLFFTFILGPVGIILGFVAYSKGDKLGRWAALMSVATTVLGTALALAAGAFLRSRLGA